MNRRSIALFLGGLIVGAGIVGLLALKSTVSLRSELATAHRTVANLRRATDPLRSTPPVLQGAQPQAPRPLPAPPRPREVATPVEPDHTSAPQPKDHGPSEQARALAIIREQRSEGVKEQFSARIHLFAPQFWGSVVGDQAPAGRLGPDSAALSLLKREPKDVWEQGRSELWQIFDEESSVQGALGSRTHEVIVERHTRKAFDDSIVAIELIEGRLYVVRSGDDSTTDKLVSELNLLSKRRVQVYELYGN